MKKNLVFIIYTKNWALNPVVNTIFQLGQKKSTEITVFHENPRKTQKNPVGFKNPWVFFKTQKPAGFEPCYVGI